MKKQNKIIVAVEADIKMRKKLLAAVAVKLGFALTNSDANKIIKSSVYDIDIRNSYYILASNYSFRESSNTNQTLFEMASRGIAVIVGVRSIPKEFEFLCEAYYPEDFSL